MAVNQPPKAKCKRKGRPRVERVQHIIEFIDWEWDYMFGVVNDPGRFNDGPYTDYRHLEIKAKILHPTSIKASIAEVTCHPDYRLSESEDRRRREPSKAVGYVDHWGKDCRYSLRLPADAFGLVLQMMIAGKYRFLLIEADKSFRGGASIYHFTFSASLDEDDLALTKGASPR
jgi:hypothetical protein